MKRKSACHMDHTKIKFLARAVEQQSETTNTSFDENKIYLNLNKIKEHVENWAKRLY
jgi:hypothetical protein